MNDWVLMRNDNNARISLPQDLQWVDEFDWSAVAQSAPVYSLGGSLLIQRGVKLAGRPITLSGEWAWQKRGNLLELRDWSDEPGLQMTLIHYDGRQFKVAFRLHDGAFNSVTPVHFSTPEYAADYYTFTLQLMTV